jgi:hypothetical protein
MTGYQSKKLVTDRHADPVTIEHIIALRKENARLREALRIIRDELGDTPRDSMRAYEISDDALHGRK